MGAEDLLKKQQAEQVASKQAEERLRMSRMGLEVHENVVKKQALDAGFDPADPIKGFHDAVDAFNKEKDEFDVEKQKFAVYVTNYNTQLELLNDAKKRFQEEVATQQAKAKTLDDAIIAKTKELMAKTEELADTQKALQTIAEEITTKKNELEDIGYKITLALKKCRKLVLEAEDRRDFYYNQSMGGYWGRFTIWVKDLFRDLRI